MRTLESPAPGLQIDVGMARSWALTTETENREFERADIVLVDLEDGTPPERKAALRRRLRDNLERGVPHWVRINSAFTEDWHRDVAELARHEALQGVMLAKTESGAEARRTVEAFAGRPVVALIESARGIESAFEIGSVSGVARLAFGSGDYRRDTGVGDDSAALTFPRSRLTVASRAAGLPGPVDGPTLGGNLDDLDAGIGAALNLGMRAKLVLDPMHVAHVNRAFRPTADAVTRARRTKEGIAVSDGSVSPRLALAERTLSDEKYYAHIDGWHGEEMIR